MNRTEYNHLLGKARDAWAVQSTGERVAVALVLNRPDWLASMGYTLAEAVDRTGAAWLELVPHVARQIQDEREG